MIGHPQEVCGDDLKRSVAINRYIKVTPVRMTLTAQFL